MLPLTGQLLAATGFTALAGLLPGAVFASIDRVAPSAVSIPLVTGMIFQGAGIGQVAGPAGLSLVVDGGGGWLAGALLILAIGLCGALFAAIYGIRGRSRRAIR
jgi:hypothetical protein